MIELDDYNKMAHLRHFQVNGGKPRLNGIACPDCGSELFDSDPRYTLASNPPQKNVHCDECGFRGYRIA